MQFLSAPLPPLTFWLWFQPGCIAVRPGFAGAMYSVPQAGVGWSQGWRVSSGRGTGGVGAKCWGKQASGWDQVPGGTHTYGVQVPQQGQALGGIWGGVWQAVRGRGETT